MEDLMLQRMEGPIFGLGIVLRLVKAGTVVDVTWPEPELFNLPSCTLPVNEDDVAARGRSTMSLPESHALSQRWRGGRRAGSRRTGLFAIQLKWYVNYAALPIPHVKPRRSRAWAIPRNLLRQLINHNRAKMISRPALRSLSRQTRQWPSRHFSASRTALADSQPAQVKKLGVIGAGQMVRLEIDWR